MEGEGDEIKSRGGSENFSTLNQIFQDGNNFCRAFLEAQVRITNGGEVTKPSI